MFRTSNKFKRAFMATIAIMLLSSGFAIAQEEQPPLPERIVIVDINSASVEEIEEIVIDELLAQRIVENRPYANKRQLVSRELVTLEQYDEIKDRIVARRQTPSPQ